LNPGLHGQPAATETPAEFAGQLTAEQKPVKNVGALLLARIFPEKPALHVQPPSGTLPLTEFEVLLGGHDRGMQPVAGVKNTPPTAAVIILLDALELYPASQTQLLTARFAPLLCSGQLTATHMPE